MRFPILKASTSETQEDTEHHNLREMVHQSLHHALKFELLTLFLANKKIIHASVL